MVTLVEELNKNHGWKVDRPDKAQISKTLGRRGLPSLRAARLITLRGRR